MSSQITLKDVYNIANEIKGELVKVTDDHEKRIRVIESNENKRLGAFAVLSFIVGFAGDYLRDLMFKR